MDANETDETADWRPDQQLARMYDKYAGTRPADETAGEAGVGAAGWPG
jgi:hypothetical protein